MGSHTKRAVSLAFWACVVVGMVANFIGFVNCVACECPPLEPEWLYVAEAFASGGEVVSTIDVEAVEDPEELSDIYHNAGTVFAQASATLSDLEAYGLSEIMGSMATQFTSVGDALGEADFASAANALCNLADQLEFLIYQGVEGIPAIVEALQNAADTLRVQGGTAFRIADLSPWLLIFEDLLDFYDAYSIEELQQLANGYIEFLEKADPESLLWVDAPEAGILENLSNNLAGEEFQEWLALASADLPGWLNQCGRLGFIVGTVDVGEGFYTVGTVMGSLLGSPACLRKCPQPCQIRGCVISKIGFTTNGNVQPGDWSIFKAIMNLIVDVGGAKADILGVGKATLDAWEGLFPDIKFNWHCGVWVKVSWEHCEKNRTWAKHESKWKLVKPPLREDGSPDFDRGALTTKEWKGQIEWFIKKVIDGKEILEETKAGKNVRESINATAAKECQGL